MTPTVISAVIGGFAVVVGAVTSSLVTWAIARRTSRDARIAAELQSENAKQARIDAQGQVVYENVWQAYQDAKVDNAQLRQDVEELRRRVEVAERRAHAAERRSEAAEARAEQLQGRLEECLGKHSTAS